MSEFTPGKWWIAPPIFDGDAIFAPSQVESRRNEVVAMGIQNKADARLIVAAPELYDFLCDANSFLTRMAIDKTIMAAFAKSVAGLVDEETLLKLVIVSNELLDGIDGEETEHV